MHFPHVVRRRPLCRRSFLRGSGAAVLSLPWLDAMATPSYAAATGGGPAPAAPKRFVAACATLGFHKPFLTPEAVGRDYQLTPYLEPLAQHRDKFSVLSGLAHLDQQGNNGHASEMTWLTSARRPGLPGFKNTISLDQLIAERIGVETRYPYLALSTSGRSMSWTASGVEIPGETSPANLFRALFVDGTPTEVAGEMRSLARGQSILDTVRDEAERLNRELGGRDREKLGEYLAAVRDLEVRLQRSQGWSQKPKPKVEAEAPKDIADRNDVIGRQRLMYDMIALALATDSTRTITFQLSGLNSTPTIQNVHSDWHGLSHHGKDPAKIDELKIIETAEFTEFGRFLTRLQGLEEQGASLLDHTAVLFGSNLGNASSHDWRDLALVLAG
ncbi:MAG: DUF1552 domain-containing protein, partial [Planctomycetales bacterium]|nr:DUF1552 domain-containing protein [Planctomycetales bacterium]